MKSKGLVYKYSYPQYSQMTKNHFEKQNDRSYCLLTPLICQAVNKVSHVYVSAIIAHKINSVTPISPIRKRRLQMTEWLPQLISGWAILIQI